MDNYSDFIVSVLKEASNVASQKFGKVSGLVKPGDNNQVLSAADLEVGSLIINRIKQSFAGHNIIDEEAGVIDNHSDFTWVIDPIDGTSNFVRGVLTYGIMIGLLKNGEPVAGGIAMPSLQEIYSAAKHKGAFCNSRQLAVTTETNLMNVLVAYGIDGHQEEPERTRQEVALLGDIVLQVRNVRMSNSCFDQAMVAQGKYGASLNRTSKIWDNVAQQIIIEEAGGLYTDFYGRPIDYNEPLQKAQDNFTWCAASPALHPQLTRITERWLPEN